MNFLQDFQTRPNGTVRVGEGRCACHGACEKRKTRNPHAPKVKGGGAAVAIEVAEGGAAWAGVRVSKLPTRPNYESVRVGGWVGGRHNARRKS